MQINVLGTFEVTRNEISIAPQTRKPRQILALLALRADQLVPITTLMEEIWGDDPPRSAATTLQTYIMQLRAHISATGESPKELLVTRPNGYMLRVRPYRSDVADFESLALAGGRARADGDHPAAAHLLRQALAKWRGPALVDVAQGRVLALEAECLHEARMLAIEQRIDADLRLGRHSQLLPELRMLVADQPMKENLRALLMLALHKSGSTWRALEEFQQLRETLVRELGIEPSERLQQLHRAILSDAPELTVDALARF